MDAPGINNEPKIEETIKTNNFQTPKNEDTWRIKHFTLNICKGKRIQIIKPLLYLKLALFLWFAGATSARTFFTVFLKQKGLSIPDISFIYIITPIVQILCTSLLSILADKIGRSKPILIGNILFTAATALLLNLISHTQQEDIQTQAFIVECMEFNVTIAKAECSLEDRIIQLKSCDVFCQDYVKKFNSHSDDLSCSLSKEDAIQSNSLIAFLNATQYRNATCIYGTNNFTLSNDFLSVCYESGTNLCQVSCITNKSVSRNHPAWIYIVISLLFFVSFVNVFRFFDITVMALAKEHDADYGLHRFFSICGNLIGPALSGYIVTMTTPEGEEAFYEAAFYAYIVFCILTALVVLKVDVRAASPAKNMWKNSLVLMRNPNAMFAGLVIIILGTTWGFNIIFKYWYLEDLSAEPYAFGMIEVINSLTGLPILVASKWLIGKIGTTNIFVLSLGFKMVFCFGYSFLQTVWPAFILELTVSISIHLLWVAVMHFCRSISPPELTATVNALAGSLHFALGRVLGSVIGGSIMNKFGGRMAFMVLGSVNAATAVIYGTFLMIRHIYRKKN